MAHEHDTGTASPFVRDFIASEMARRGLSRRACRERLVAEILADASESLAWDESPEMPPEGDPSYDPAVHGPRSRDHLRQLVDEGFRSGPGERGTPALLEEIKAAARRHVGLPG